MPLDSAAASVLQEQTPPTQSAKSDCKGRGAGFGAVLLWMAVGVAVGIVAAWPMGRASTFFRAGPLPQDLMGRMPADPFASLPPEVFAEIVAHQRVALLRNTALAFGICGAMSLTAFGLLYGLSLRRWHPVFRALAGCPVVGAAGGALGGALAVTLESRLRNSGVSDPVVWMGLSLAVAWAAPAVGCGILAAWVAWDRRVLCSAARAAVAAALIAAVLFVPTAMILFPLERLDRLILPSFALRAYGVSLATGLLALALGRALVRHKRVHGPFDCLKSNARCR